MVSRNKTLISVTPLPPSAFSCLDCFVAGWAWQKDVDIYSALLRTLEGHQRQILGTLTGGFVTEVLTIRSSVGISEFVCVLCCVVYVRDQTT